MDFQTSDPYKLEDYLIKQYNETGMLPVISDHWIPPKEGQWDYQPRYVSDEVFTISYSLTHGFQKQLIGNRDGRKVYLETRAPAVDGLMFSR